MQEYIHSIEIQLVRRITKEMDLYKYKVTIVDERGHDTIYSGEEKIPSSLTESRFEILWAELGEKIKKAILEGKEAKAREVKGAREAGS